MIARFQIYVNDNGNSTSSPFYVVGYYKSEGVGGLQTIETLPSEWNDVDTCCYQYVRSSTVFAPNPSIELSDTYHLKIENEENGCYDLLAYSMGSYLGISQRRDALNYSGVLDLDCWQNITKPKGLFIRFQWTGAGSLGTFRVTNVNTEWAEYVGFAGAQDLFEFPDVKPGSYAINKSGGSVKFQEVGSASLLNVSITSTSENFVLFDVLSDFAILTVILSTSGGQSGGVAN